MSHLHLCPFTPHLSELIDGLEIDLGGLFKDVPRALEVFFCFARRTALFVEFCEVDVYPVEVRGGLARMYG